MVVRGEGEFTFLHLLETWRKTGTYGDVNGIGFLDANGVYMESGNTWGVRVKNLEELPDLIQSALMYKPESDSLDKYLSLIEENSFDFDYLDFLNKFSNTFYREDRLTNVDIPESKMKEFSVQNGNFNFLSKMEKKNFRTENGNFHFQPKVEKGIFGPKWNFHFR